MPFQGIEAGGLELRAVKSALSSQALTSNIKFRQPKFSLRSRLFIFTALRFHSSFFPLLSPVALLLSVLSMAQPPLQQQPLRFEVSSQLLVCVC